MDHISKWFEFLHEARRLVLQGQEIDHSWPNIQISIEPSFDNSIFLQLIIKNDFVEWYRTTWLRLVDAPKFAPIEGLKYIGQVIKPTLKYESGTVNKEDITDIIYHVERLSVPVVLEKSRSIMLDGTYYTLTIGAENTQVTYAWHNLPNHWAQLQKLTELLEAFNEQLAFKGHN
jgi:hypothetical protein